MSIEILPQVTNFAEITPQTTHVVEILEQATNVVEVSVGIPGTSGGSSIYAEDGSVTPPNNFLDLRGGGRGTFWETRSSNGGGAAEGGIYPGFWADGTGFEADNSEGGHTYLHTSQDSGSYHLYLPAANGTLASQEWVEDQAYIADAPDNGLTYARNSGSWVVIGVASNSVAPVLSPSSATFTGVQLSVSHGTWSGYPSSYSYQWQVSTDGSTWTDISGATAATFTPDSSYATKYVRAAVIATNGFGPSAAAFSDPTAELSVASFPPGAIAYWKLDDDESGGVSLVDSTGNGNDLTNNNGVALGIGILNGCSVFGGSGYLTNLTLPTASQFSISFWFNYISYNVTNSTISGCDAAVIYNNGDYFRNYTQEENLSPANYNTWNHFVATFDGTDYKSYFNGVLIATTAMSATCSDINFGSYGGSQICDGKLDEAAIWPRALSAEEVTALYGGGTPPSYS
jgi:hypothetical protein